MPANVSVEFAKAREKYTQARTNLEKLAALEEMRRFAPKHKGGENLRAEISAKIAKIKQEIEKEKQLKAKKGSGVSLAVKKEGCAQVAIIGLPNSGKSTLLNKLTNANAEVAAYEFTTTKPEVGAMDYYGAKIQLVEYPAIIEGSSQGKAQGTQILGAIRTADALLICVKNDDDIKIIEKELKEAGILVNEEKPKIEIKSSQTKGIDISGKEYLKVPLDDLLQFLNNAGVKNANIIVSEPADLEKFAKVLDDSLVYKKALIINPFVESDLESLKHKIFSIIDKILVYTKKPGEEPDLKQPLVLRKGSTVEDLACELHKDIAKNMKFARVWGSTKFPGQRVAKDYILQNRDIVEINF